MNNPLKNRSHTYVYLILGTVLMLVMFQRLKPVLAQEPVDAIDDYYTVCTSNMSSEPLCARMGETTSVSKFSVD